MDKIRINTPTITLAQLLKWAEVTGSGGESKALCASGRVRVNGQVETRRGRTIIPGDVIEVQLKDKLKYLQVTGE